MFFLAKLPNRIIHSVIGLEHTLLSRVLVSLITLKSKTRNQPRPKVKKQPYMKKYIVILAALALAIGGSINLTGCGGADPAPTPPAGGGDDGNTTDE